MKTTIFWCILSFVTAFLVYGLFSPLLTFTIQWDDWAVYWSVRNNLGLAHTYWAHPASMYEFIAFSNFISPYSTVWMHAGLVLKIILSLAGGTLLYALTKSRVAQTIAVIIIAISYIGFDALTLVNAHLTLILGIEFCLGFACWIEFLETGNKSRYHGAIFFFVLSLFTDLFRAIPFLLLLFILIPVYKTKFTGPLAQKTANTLLILSVICVIAFMYLYRPLHTETELTRQLRSGISFTSLKGLVLIYFTSIGVFLTSIIKQFPIGGGNPWTNRILYVSSVTIFGLISLYLSGRFYKKYKSFFPVIFLLLWIFGFHFSQWFYEPRLIPDAVHRYALLPGIGIQLLAAYFLSRIKNYYLFFSALAVLFLFTLIRDQQIIHAHYAQSKNVIIAAWKFIDKSVPDTDNHVLLYVAGEEPFLDTVFRSSGSYPLAIQRDIRKQDLLPEIVFDIPAVIKKICYKQTQNVPKYTIDSLFSFSVDSFGNITDETNYFRKYLQNELKQRDCL